MNNTKKYLDDLSQQAAAADADNIEIYITRSRYARNELNDIADAIDTRTGLGDVLVSDLYSLAGRATMHLEQAERWQEAMGDNSEDAAEFRKI